MRFVHVLSAMVWVGGQLLLSLLLLPVLRRRLAAHRGLTLPDLATLLGSVGVVLLATALVS